MKKKTLFRNFRPHTNCDCRVELSLRVKKNFYELDENLKYFTCQYL